MKTPQSASPELAAESSGGPVQRVSCPVQRGQVAAPPEDAAGVGIGAITQKAGIPVSVRCHVQEIGALRAAAQNPTPRRILRTFKPRFARLVEAGKKFQTVRPIPKRAQDMPRPDDLFDAREWTGLPRRSKMRKLFPEPQGISGVNPITIHATGQIEIRGRYLSTVEMEAFARADGFADLAEMLAWFRAEHELPFTGIVIDWLPF